MKSHTILWHDLRLKNAGKDKKKNQIDSDNGKGEKFHDSLQILIIDKIIINHVIMTRNFGAVLLIKNIYRIHSLNSDFIIYSKPLITSGFNFIPTSCSHCSLFVISNI